MQHTNRNHQTYRCGATVRLLLVLAAVVLVWACGGDSPAAPPPEPARATTVTVSPATVELVALGATMRLTAEVRDQNARVMAGATVTWGSSDTSVAEVDAAGLVTAAGNGTATITVSAGSASGSATVTVMQSLDSVEVSPPTVELAALGATVQLTAEAFDANGHAVAGAEFSWETSDTSVAATDTAGLVTAAGNGTATITAGAGPASGSAVVTVRQSAALVKVSPSEGTVAVGETQQLVAEAFDANGHAVAAAEFFWASSEMSIAMVDATGLVAAVAPGEVDITATSEGVTGTARLQVTGFTLSGTVSDGRREGFAVPGATVRLQGGTTEPVTTDAEGRYRLADVAGSVRITVAADPGYVEQTVEVTVDSDRTLDFVLEHTGEAPYPGTAWVTPDILGPSDPTSLGSVVYTGSGTREVFDRRAEMWVTVDAYLFEAQFGERTVEFQVNPEFGSTEAARAQVDVFAPAIGRLPAVLMSNVREVELNAGEGLFGGNSYNGSLLIHADDPATLYAVRAGFLEEVFVHEAAHASLDPRHLDNPGWRAARQADRAFISEYARDYPDREDVAESILPYFAVRYRPDRLTAAQRWLMTTTIPNRMAYFDEQGFDMSPYTPAEPITLAPATEPVRPLPQILRRFEEPPITRR